MSKEFNFDEQLERLVKLADEKGVLDTGALDELVQDAASNIASGVNNEGTEAQIKYLLTLDGPGAIKAIEEALDELVQDAASNIASGVNNEGTEAQIKYLLTLDGPGAIKAIEEAFDEEAE